MSRDPRLYLEDIRESCQKIERYIAELNVDNFMVTEPHYDGVILNLHIIGEAARNIPVEIQQRYPEVEWRAMTALRNIISHEYFGVRYEIIWDIVTTKVPVLLSHVERILEDIGTPRLD